MLCERSANGQVHSGVRRACWAGSISSWLCGPGFVSCHCFGILSSRWPFNHVRRVSIIPFTWNVFKSWRYGEPVTVDDPWGYGNSLEWATSCPSPRHNFTELPRIRSERPAFELHYPP